jgi:wyosine [tRNA(Phe)-imidazoG37] synthetase (radical SAM superfamily)
MTSDDSTPLFLAHPRTFEENRYVYPVLSRRAGGISVGVNLNRDKACNFRCAYCQVDRTTPGTKEPLDLQRLVKELDAMFEFVLSGAIYKTTKFSRTPPELRRLNDIAISGDGEPTTCERIEEVMAACAAVLRRFAREDVKLVLITNASLFHRERVRRALSVLDEAGGEIWAKLDAGTEEYFRLVCQSKVTLERILDNVCEAARRRPIVIQSLFARIHEEPPPPAEVEAYCKRLREIVAAGGQIKQVQIHTVARVPTEAWVSALSAAEAETIAEQVGRETGLAVKAYYA